MKKQIHILEGFLILTLILLLGLFIIKFIYHIKHEHVDTSTMWNIEFVNLKVKEGSKEGIINLKNNTIDLDVSLEKENDFYEFTIDVQNNGSLDAKITTYKINVDNPQDILKYRVTYLNDVSIDKGDILKSKESKTIKIRVEYPEGSPKTKESLNLKLTLNIEYSSIY